MNNLRWILEAATRPRDEEGQLDELVNGKNPEFLVAIYEGADPDPELSAISGRTRYRNTAMIAVRVKGEKDFVSVPMGDEHRRRFPRATKWWDANKQGTALVSVRLLPGITPADIAELDDLKLSDVDALAAADVPDNLLPWQVLAKRLRTLSKPRMRLVEGSLKEVA